MGTTKEIVKKQRNNFVHERYLDGIDWIDM